MSKAVIDEAFLQKLELLDMYIRDNVAGAFGGNHQSKKYGSSSEFADFREYIPGDDIRRIDWNVFARFEKLFLKLYLDERQMHTRIYIDASLSMIYGDESKANMALQLAAIFTYFSIKSMDKVSVYYIQGHKRIKIIDRIVGKDSFYNAIGELNNIEFKGESFISDAIINSTTGYGNGMSIIISDFLTNNDFKQAINHLKEKKRDVLCLQVLSNEEITPSSKGKMIFYDAETNSSYKKNITKDVLNAYKEALDFIRKDLYHFAKTRNSSYIFVNSNSSLDQIILKDAIQEEVIK